MLRVRIAQVHDRDTHPGPQGGGEQVQTLCKTPHVPGALAVEEFVGCARIWRALVRVEEDDDEGEEDEEESRTETYM